jgi:DNA polymerase III epsilon subunit-like protein
LYLCLGQEEKLELRPLLRAGISDDELEQALREGIELKPAFEAFLDLVEKSTALVAHNALYDKLILDRVMIDLNYSGSFLMDRPLVCTKELTTPVCKLPGFRGQFKWPTLQEAHLYFFGEEFASAHSALADVRACARIFFEGRARNLWV